LHKYLVLKVQTLKTQNTEILPICLLGKFW